MHARVVDHRPTTTFHTVSPRTSVNRARAGEEGPFPHIVYNGCGQELVVAVVVIDSYAIPDGMLTAVYLVMSYWP
jgi:hypothetical protein